MILLKTFLTPMGLKPGFLLRGMSRQARNLMSEVESSLVQSFLVTLLVFDKDLKTTHQNSFIKRFASNHQYLNQRDQILPLFSWLLSLSFLHRSLQTLLGVFFPERLITLHFHKQPMGRDVLV